MDYVPISRPLPRAIARLGGVRTVVNETLYVARLRRLRTADVVHVFSAAYWSFLLAPVPAMLAGRALARASCCTTTAENWRTISRVGDGACTRGFARRT